MASVAKLFLEVLQAFTLQKPIADAAKSQFTTEALGKLYTLSVSHDVCQIVADVLFKNDLLPHGEAITERFQKRQMEALYRYAKLEREQQSAYSLFEQHQIRFIPLKGSVVRAYYPDSYMRTSCDIDILVDESELERAQELLITELGYRIRKPKGYHDVSLLSANDVHLELHYNLKQKQENLDELLVRVWDFSTNTEFGAYYKLETPEFYIFHHIAHMVNHFLRGGCGIRAFLDLFFIKKGMRYNSAVLAELLKQCGLEDFFVAAMQCVSAWFEGEEATQISVLVAEFILGGGVYGSKTHRLSLEQNKRGGKMGYYLSRFFLPYDTLKYKYPILQKHKYLLPLFWMSRFFAVFSPARRSRIKHEIQTGQHLSNNRQSNVKAMMDILKI